jgi:hypothetical protein
MDHALRCVAQPRTPQTFVISAAAEYLRATEGERSRREQSTAEKGSVKLLACFTLTLLKCGSCVTHSIYARGTHAHTLRDAPLSLSLSLSLSQSLSVLLYVMAASSPCPEH